MRVCFLLGVLLLMVFSCNDIDGEIEVFRDFELEDEDGRMVTIAAGSYVAEIEYDAEDSSIELEIDLGRRIGKRDFIIDVPDISSEDFRKERFETEVPVGDGEILAHMLIENTLLSRKGPYARYDRCYCNRSAGHRHDPYICGSVIRTYYPSIFYKVRRQLDAVAELKRGEEVLAQFTGAEVIKERDTVYLGQCDEKMDKDKIDEYEEHDE